MDEVLEWAKSRDAKPLIIDGARQTGKSTLVRKSGENFGQYLELNLEKSTDRQRLEQVQSVAELKEVLEVVYHLVPNTSTLLFFDEVQAAPNIVRLLRYLREEAPEWHVIATGSLLGPMIEREGREFPVGRVTFLRLHPFTFTEFLQATGYSSLVEQIIRMSPGKPLSATLHREALMHLYAYFAVGGMPEAVARHVAGGPMMEVRKVYDDLLTTYQEDVYKYGKDVQTGHLVHLIRTLPSFAGTIAAYAHLGEGHYRTREMHEAAGLLERVHIVTQVEATEAVRPPLHPRPRRQGKWLYLDAGFLWGATGVDVPGETAFNRLHESFRGRFLEQYVGQQLLALPQVPADQLRYWAVPRGKGEAEVDFCFPYQGRMVAVDVKASEKAASRSLLSLYDRNPEAILVQCGPGPLARETVVFAGKDYPLLRLPWYAVEALPRILDQST
jgi:uncharacterized protein